MELASNSIKSLISFGRTFVKLVMNFEVGIEASMSLEVSPLICSFLVP